MSRPRHPGVSAPIPRLVNPPAQSSFKPEHRPMLTCLDLDKVPEDLRPEAIRALAAGSNVGLLPIPASAPEWTSVVPSTYTPGDAIFAAILANAGAAILAMIVANVFDPSYRVWIWLAFAVLATAIPVRLWFKNGSREVLIDDAIDVKVDFADLGKDSKNIAAQIQENLKALVEFAPEALTDEVWLAAYQAQADLAVRHRLRALTDEDATARANELFERASQVRHSLAALRKVKVDIPKVEAQMRAEAEAKQAAEDALADTMARELAQRELERQTTRAELAAYLKPEPKGNYVEIVASEATEPTGNHTDPGFGQPAYAPYPIQKQEG